MDALTYLSQRVATNADYHIIRSAPATEAALTACEKAIGSRLPLSLLDCLKFSDGFELLDPAVSVVRVYSASEIAASTTAMREFWVHPDGISPWGDFIELARSDHTESVYAIHPLAAGKDETPLHEIWPEGTSTWQTDPPLAATFGQWLMTIAEAISTGEHQRVYDALWRGSPKRG